MLISKHMQKKNLQASLELLGMDNPTAPVYAALAAQLTGTQDSAPVTEEKPSAHAHARTKQ